jgi:hypothetical protein
MAYAQYKIATSSAMAYAQNKINESAAYAYAYICQKDGIEGIQRGIS